MVVLDRHVGSFLAWVSWNFMLALIPVLLAFTIYGLVTYYRKHSYPKQLFWTLIIILGFAWLIFLPNTGYLITGWRHFFVVISREELFSRWYDTRDLMVLMRISLYSIFFIWYSFFGLFTLTLSIRPLAKLLQPRSVYMSLIGIPLFFVTSLGIYLGLILRFNSWDLFVRPGYVIKEILLNLQRPTLLTLIILFAIVLWIGYWFTDIWIDGFLARRKAAKDNRHAR